MVKKVLIWAQTLDGTIALNGQIPWHQRSDIRFFAQTTRGQVVVMGRHTMESMHGRALPGRTNLVLTHDANLTVPAGFERILSMAEAEEIAQQKQSDLMIIGGKPIYESYLPTADQLLVTYLQSDLQGDVKMDPVNLDQWQRTIVQTGPADTENDYAYEIVNYQRN
ncbi:dihydrofolate reductase [Weissella kandleri]|uniref:Dihydrofolate reductase n=1 Tax=Weissella kandleri TaxID=1616 RepID=A0A0R2JEH7_9LACO|nr:dihydrofolate reductase [Weissella kandleri]KRN75779.1 dihydrofolate reductase [Weissella kandleri]